jgi:hypothetical protein
VPRFSDERIRAILTKPTTPRVVAYPAHPELQIAVRCLDDIDLDLCRVEAQRKLRDTAKARGWDPLATSEIDPVLLERKVEREIVLRAFFDAETLSNEKPTPFFASERELALLGSAGVTDLMEVYAENQDWMNPSVSLSPDEERRLVDELGKERTANATLTAIGPATLRRLLISMAKRLRDYQCGRSSTSSDSESSTPEP